MIQLLEVQFLFQRPLTREEHLTAAATFTSTLKRTCHCVALKLVLSLTVTVCHKILSEVDPLVT